jgi:glucose-6-phosphate isomerase
VTDGIAALSARAPGLLASPSWSRLAARAAALPPDWPRQWLDQPDRYQACSAEAAGLLIDYSRQPVDGETLRLLQSLAGERDLPAWIEALFGGAPVNTTENRPALHMVLRAPDGSSAFGLDDGERAAVVVERERWLALAEAVRSGGRRGATGKPFRTIINIGIGGSDLGPVMAVEALRPLVRADLELRFASNVDGVQLADALAAADAETTLFVICSKSFGTLETALNAETARRWLAGRLGDAAVAAHFVAVSTNTAAMDRFGIAPDLRFRLWDWIGGRYSLWSAIGLVVAIGIGATAFRQLLAGAAAMDEHFRTAPMGRNLPVLLGSLAVWNQNLLGAETHAVLPYDSRLHRLPAYLQQLEMESNGKGVDRTGQPVPFATGPIIWGEPGSNAQHSFFQLLHQGTRRFTADFIAPANGSGPFRDQHLEGLANLLAQAEAFTRGYDVGEARAELAARGLGAGEQAALAPHKAHPGGHGVTLILCDRLDPGALGALVALYEHKVFVQAVLWGINPFDQWGVELGKRLAVPMLAALRGDAVRPLPPAGQWLRGRYQAG